MSCGPRGCKGSSRRRWRPQVAALEDEFDTVVYDYRGHGKTGSTNDPSYTISLLADDLRALLDELEIERPVLCGHSYGGLIAAEYAIQYPDDVAGLVFADARTDMGETLFENVMLRVYPTLRRAEDVIGRDRFRAAMEFIADRFVNAEQGPDEKVPELGMTPSEYFETDTDVSSLAEQRKLIAAGFEYVGASPTDFSVPVLYAYGELTGDVIADKADRLERAPTDVGVRAIKNAGHGVPLEQPDAFTDALRTFLTDVTDAS